MDKAGFRKWATITASRRPPLTGTRRVLRARQAERGGLSADLQFPTPGGTPLSRNALERSAAKHAAPRRAVLPGANREEVSIPIRHSAAAMLPLNASSETSVIALWLSALTAASCQRCVTSPSGSSVRQATAASPPPSTRASTTRNLLLATSATGPPHDLRKGLGDTLNDDTKPSLWARFSSHEAYSDSRTLWNRISQSLFRESMS